MPDDDQPFEATIKIKSGARVNLVVNQVINVLYDPADRRKVVIDESALRKDMVMDAIARAKASGAKPSSHVDALERLANLRDRGVLTDAEFDAEKRKILET
jgi:hypothetical protein